MEDEDRQQLDAPEPTRDEVMDNALRLDPRNLQLIIEAVRSEPNSNSQPCSSTTPMFKREGFARQFDSNTSIIRKLVPLRGYEGIGFVISDVIQDLNSRNETLKIADNHPEVLQFLDSKNKADLLKITDPKLSEFLETIKKKEDDGSRKGKTTPLSQPSWKRETSWPPAFLPPRSPSSGYQGAQFEDRLLQQYGYHQQWPNPDFQRRTMRTQFPRRDISSVRRFPENRSYFKDREYDRRKVSVKDAAEKATGGRIVRKETFEFSAGSIHRQKDRFVTSEIYLLK